MVDATVLWLILCSENMMASVDTKAAKSFHFKASPNAWEKFLSDDTKFFRWQVIIAAIKTININDTNSVWLRSLNISIFIFLNGLMLVILS